MHRWPEGCKCLQGALDSRWDLIKTCVLGGRRIVYPEFVQSDFCLNLAVVLKAVSTLGVAILPTKESMLLNGRNMLISGGTGQLLCGSCHFPLKTGADDSKGCSDETFRDRPSLPYFFSSHQPSPPLSSLPVTLSSVLPPLLSLSQVSHMKPQLLQCTNKGFAEVKYKSDKKKSLIQEGVL